MSCSDGDKMIAQYHEDDINVVMMKVMMSMLDVEVIALNIASTSSILIIIFNIVIIANTTLISSSSLSLMILCYA